MSGILLYQILHTNGQTSQVDTNVNPPRSIWVHPYEDAQYLHEHPDVRRMLDKLTVKKLAADRSRLVCVKPNFSSLHVRKSLKSTFVQDITKYVNRDAEEHKFPIGVGAGGNVFRGIYLRTDPSTQQVQSLNVSNHIRTITWSQMTD